MCPVKPTCPPMMQLAPIRVLPEMPVCAAMTVWSPTDHVVRDLDEVVELRPAPIRVSPIVARSIVRVRADLHVVLDHHDAELGDLLVRAVLPGREPESVASDDSAGLEDDAGADPAPFPYRDVGI